MFIVPENDKVVLISTLLCCVSVIIDVWLRLLFGEHYENKSVQNRGQSEYNT